MLISFLPQTNQLLSASGIILERPTIKPYSFPVTVIAANFFFKGRGILGQVPRSALQIKIGEQVMNEGGREYSFGE